MRTFNFLKFAAIIFLFFNSIIINAQVTIGADKAPESFSLLELVSGNNKGLRLPQIESTAQRDEIFTDAAGFKNNPLTNGLQIYNMETRCIEYWDNVKWVSLCLGTANITLIGEPSGCDHTAPIPATGTQDKCTYIPVDDPPCTVPSGQAYQVYMTAGSAYATLIVDERTSAFSITFVPNNSKYSRIAVVRVVNNCSGEFQDFPFIQEGATCPVVDDPIVGVTSNTICAGGSTYAYVTNAQPDVEYVWEYAGTIIHTGNYLEVKHAGTYTVYAGLFGCGTGATFTITTSETTAPYIIVVSASNAGMICGPSGNVVLSANPAPTGTKTVQWFHNGIPHDIQGTPIIITGQEAAGEWFAAQMDNSDNCQSSKSNTLNIIYNENPSSLPNPIVTVNNQSITGPITICKGGTLELKVSNSYPAGTFFEWFDNGVSISKSDQPVFYTIAPDREDMTLSVEVSNNAGGCHVSAMSPKTNITVSAPPSTTINNGASKASICGSGEAILIADNSSGVEYQWLLNGTAIPSATSAIYKTQIPGSYSVRYKNSSDCWSIISANIQVETNVAKVLSWMGGTPSTTEIFPNDKTYAVTSIPAAESYTWYSDNPAVASITPVGNGQSATISYKAAGNVTITVTSADDGCGVANLSLPVTVTTGCAPITALSLIPSGTPAIKRYVNADGSYLTPSDGYTDFVVMANGGAHPTSYQWYVNNVLQPSATGDEFKYTTPTDGTQDAVIKVTVKNSCTPDIGDAGISVQATVSVMKFAAEDQSGAYRMSGKTCFDIAQSNDGGSCASLSSRVNDFEASNPSQTYTFMPTSSSTYSNLSFVINDPNGLISSSTQNIASGTTTNPSTLTIMFNKAAVMAKAFGTNKVTALNITIIAMYKDINNADKQISLTLSIQDCTCGCTVKKAGGGYITFMCYNLGASETTKTKTALEQAMTPSPTGDYVTDASMYGDLYQWGRKADGHEKRTSLVYDLGSNSFNIVYDGNGQIQSSSSTYYGRFITTSNSPYDWHGNSVSYQNNNLWNFTIYPANNPCPPGWRVPTQAEWSSIIQGGTTSVSGIPSTGQNMSNSGNYWKWNPATNGTPGWLVSPDGGTNYTLFLPAIGERNYKDAKVGAVGGASVYWNTSPTTNNTLLFTSTILAPATSYVRSNGYGIRCVAE
ncbi:MAG: fibrobacter succinogenes major paralogous domain-containing protein [Paludibacter sp.]|nr:fibrobacter succinogenes major paralogous domain-containing protein [Paludibacter sp.]